MLEYISKNDQIHLIIFSDGHINDHKNDNDKFLVW